MLTVHKYEVPFLDDFELQLPTGAQFLHFGNQFERACLWCLVETNNSMTRQRFRFAGTGHAIDPEIAEALQYVGSAQFRDGALVFHLFHVQR